LKAAVPDRPADTHTTALQADKQKNTTSGPITQTLETNPLTTSFVDFKLPASLTGVYTVVATAG